MRIASGRVDAKLSFVAVDVTDLKTRETGLTGFTVYRSRNGGAATAYTTPTVAELSAANMPGVYVLTIDEDTTITAGVDEEEYVVHITQASMAPVTRAVELFRAKATEGNTLDVNASGGAEVGTFQTGAITTAAFAAGAIDNAAFNVTETLTANPAAGGIVAASFGAGAITAAVIATDAIDSDAIAASAVTELQSGLATSASLATAQADLDDIQTRLPAALVGGRIDASVGAMAAAVVTAAAVATGAIDADALASDAVAEIADGVWDEAISGHQAAGTTGRNLTLSASILGEFTLTGTPSNRVLQISGGSAVTDYYKDLQLLITSGALIGQARPIESYNGATTEITLDEALTSAPAAGVTVAILGVHAHPISQVQSGLATSAALAVAQADLDNIQTRIPASLVSGRMDASVGAMAADVLTASALATDAVNEIVDQVWDEVLSGHLTGGSTGAALNSAGSAGDPWGTALPGAYSAGSAGYIIGNNLNATVSSRATQTSVDTIDGIVDAILVDTGTTLDARIPAALTNGYMAVSVQEMAANTLTASALATDAVNEIVDQVWDEVLSGHLTAGTTGAALNGAGSAGDPWLTALPGAYGAGTAGKILGDNLNATVSSRASQASLDTVDDFLDTEVAAILADTNDIQTRLPAALVGGLMASNVSDVTDGTIVAAHFATDAISAAMLSAGAANKVADHAIRRSLATAAASGDGDAVSIRSMLGAARKLTNRVAIAAGTLTVYAEDDLTAAGTQAVTTDAGAAPIVAVDTN